MEKIPLIGVIGTSMKEDERRVPIHPEHFDRIPPNILQKLIFEKGYGLPFNISDEELSQRTGGVSSRSSLLSDIGIVIITKPVVSIFIIPYFFTTKSINFYIIHKY